MAKPGRKPKEVDPAEVEALASRCLTKTQIAEFLGISQNAFWTRVRENPEINEAFQRGRIKRVAWLKDKYIKLIEQKPKAETLQWLLERLEDGRLDSQNPDARLPEGVTAQQAMRATIEADIARIQEHVAKTGRLSERNAHALERHARTLAHLGMDQGVPSTQVNVSFGALPPQDMLALARRIRQPQALPSGDNDA